MPLLVRIALSILSKYGVKIGWAILKSMGLGVAGAVAMDKYRSAGKPKKRLKKRKKRALSRRR